MRPNEVYMCECALSNLNIKCRQINSCSFSSFNKRIKLKNKELIFDTLLLYRRNLHYHHFYTIILLKTFAKPIYENNEDVTKRIY